MTSDQTIDVDELLKKISGLPEKDKNMVVNIVDRLTGVNQSGQNRSKKEIADDEERSGQINIG
jgi:uncharacterized protein YfbU (UPF0304 family)